MWDLRGRTGAEGEAEGSQAEGGLGGVVWWRRPSVLLCSPFPRLLCCCFCSPRPVVYDAASRDRSSSALRRCLPAGWEGRQVRFRIGGGLHAAAAAHGPLQCKDLTTPRGESDRLRELEKDTSVNLVRRVHPASVDYYSSYSTA